MLAVIILYATIALAEIMSTGRDGMIGGLPAVKTPAAARLPYMGMLYVRRLADHMVIAAVRRPPAGANTVGAVYVVPAMLRLAVIGYTGQLSPTRLLAKEARVAHGPAELADKPVMSMPFEAVKPFGRQSVRHRPQVKRRCA